MPIWDVVYRAGMSYEVPGPRIKSWYPDRFKRTILSELTLEESFNIYYGIFGNDKTKEPKVDKLAAVGKCSAYTPVVNTKINKGCSG